MTTEQFNIRLPRELLDDVDLICKLLKVAKSDWIKLKLAETVRAEKNKLLSELVDLQKRGVIAKTDLQRLLGK